MDVKYPDMVVLSDMVSTQFLLHKKNLNFSQKTDDEFLHFLLSTVNNLGKLNLQACFMHIFIFKF